MGNIIFKENFGGHEHCLFSPSLKESFDKTGEIYITARLKTKTRIDLRIYSGSSAFSINFKQQGFKTDAVNEGHSIWFGDQGISHFFKKTKNQNKERFREYIAVVFDEVKKKCDIRYDAELIVYLYSNTYSAD